MTALARVRGSLRVLLLSFALIALASLLPGLIARGALPTADDPSGALVLEGLVDGAAAAGGASLSLLLLCALLGLAAPALTAALMSAQARRETLSASLGRGVERYWPVIATSLLMAPIFAVAAAVAVGLPALVSLALSDASEPTHDLATLFAALPGLALLVVWATWHDVARARVVCLREGPLSALRGARKRLTVRTFGAYVGCVGAALMLGMLGLIASASLPLVLAVVVAQLLLLSKLAFRALFLAIAVGRASS